MKKVMNKLSISQRRACKVLEQSRTTQRRDKKETEEQQMVREKIIELAKQYGRYGYRRITALLRNAGHIVNHKRVARIWREEGLKVPKNSASVEDYGLMTDRA